MIPFVQVGRLSVITIMLLSVGLLNHVIIIPILFDAAGRDAWLCVLLSAAVMFVWLFLVYSVMRDVGIQHLPEWLHAKGGILSRIIVVGLFALLLFSMAAVTTVDTVTWSTGTYLPQTPVLVTSAAFILLCGFAAYQGLHVIIYMGCILLPIVVALGFFVASANMNKKDYTQLLPLMEHGMSPIWNGMMIAGGGFAELLLFVVLQGYANKPFKRLHLFVTALMVLGLALGPVIAGLAEFGVVEVSAMRYPAFSQWRIVTVFKYIEHLDFFAIFQWISGAFIRTAASLCLLLDLLGIRTPLKRVLCLFVIGSLFVIMSAYPFGDAVQYQFLHLLRPASLIALVFLSMYMFILAKLRRKGETR